MFLVCIDMYYYRSTFGRDHVNTSTLAVDAAGSGRVAAAVVVVVDVAVDDQVMRTKLTVVSVK